MRTILFILLLILSSCLGIESSAVMPGGGPDAQPPGATVTYPVVIDAAQLVRTMTGQPALQLSGSIADGCQFPVETALRLGEAIIRVDVYRTGPADSVCPDVITPYSDTIVLPDLSPGTYTIQVNDRTFESTLSASMDGRPTAGPPQIDPTATLPVN